MKKIYFLFIALLSGLAGNAQVITNGDMELWHNATAGTAPIVNIHSPVSWRGTDSLAIAVGEAYLGDTTFVAQVFEESAFVNSGSHSAKVMSLYQDTTIGVLPGTLTNSQPSFNLLVVLGGGSPAKALTFTGGQPVTMKITTVSAYVAYFPGKDTVTHLTGLDTGSLFVQAYGVVAGKDSLLGSGIAQIVPGSTFTQVTATIAYTDTVDSVGIVRIFFASSGGGSTQAVDSSTLYVDDVTMTGVPEPIVVDTDTVKAFVPNMTIAEPVKVFPNPAIGVVYLDGPQSALLKCELFSVSGQVVADKTFSGKGSMDISYLPAGLYFYAITDDRGNSVQRGKVAVDR